MYTDFSHDYQTLEFPNVVYASDKGAEVISTITHPFMFPLVEKIAKARPNWKLVGIGRQYGAGSGPRLATRFAITEGGEVLGQITKDYYNNGDVYGVINDRISAKRERSETLRTKDVKKAFKAITQNFSGKTMTELFVATEKAVGSATHVATSNARFPFLRVVNQLETSMKQFALDNWDMYRENAVDTVVEEQAADAYHELSAAMETTMEIAEQHAAKRGYTVMLRGSEYVISKAGAMQILTSDALTPHLKQGIGILKLVENGQYVDGIGVRANENSFFVLEEPVSEGSE